MNDNKLNIVHATVGVGRTSFGLGQVALNLMREQCEMGFNSNVWCFSNAEDVAWALTSINITAQKISSFSTIGPTRLSYSFEMERAAKHNLLKMDVIHQHGIWTGVSRVTSKLIKYHNIPAIIAPHGSLSKWALNISRWKKRLALASYESNNLKNASCLQATSENEISDFRDFGLKNPIAFIENGIQKKYYEGVADTNNFYKNS